MIPRVYLERTGRCRFGMHLMQPSASETHAGNHRASFCPRNANPEWRRFDFVAGFARRRGARRDLDGREESRIYGLSKLPHRNRQGCPRRGGHRTRLGQPCVALLDGSTGP